MTTRVRGWSETRVCPCGRTWLAYGRAYARAHGLVTQEPGRRYCTRACASRHAVLGVHGREHFRQMALRAATARRQRAKTEDYRLGYNSGWRAGYRRGFKKARSSAA